MTWVVVVVGLVVGVLAIWHPFSSSQVLEETAAPVVNGRGIPEVKGGQVSVSIGGAVQRPGLYQMPVGSRVTDLLQMAGGVVGDANTSKLKLAAHLKDGDHVVVPLHKPVPAPRHRVKRGAKHPAESPHIELDPLVAGWLNRLPGPDLIKQLRLGRGDVALIEQFRLRATIRSHHDLIAAGVSPSGIRHVIDWRQRSLTW